MSEPERQKPTQTRNNGRVVFMCLFFVFGMGAMSYAAVPLYQLFCQVTGYGGTTQRVDQYADEILDRTIKVRFDANTNGLPWDFQPKQREVEVRIGETKQIFYESHNNSSAPRGGQATFNVTPQYAGVYFNKVECFCFTELTLEGGERLDMPVVFYIDPEIVEHPETKNLTTITLSYTMFPRELEKPVASVDTGDAQDGERL